MWPICERILKPWVKQILPIIMSIWWAVREYLCINAQSSANIQIFDGQNEDSGASEIIVLHLDHKVYKNVISPVISRVSASQREAYLKI